MTEQLIKILESAGIPVVRQGSYNENDELPEKFITFWNFQADERSHADNSPMSCEWGFWVYIYGEDPVEIDQIAKEIRSKLKQKGFVSTGPAMDYDSNEPNLAGKMLNVYYLESY